MKYSKEKNTGITLIALVVTIIILLILAGVTIVTLTGDNGLLNKSKLAVEKYSDGEIGEQIKLAYIELQTEKLYNSNVNDAEFLTNNLREKLNDNNLTVKVKNGKVTVNMKVKGEPKTYIYKLNTGESYEYIDPFDYKGKAKKDLVLGDDIMLGTENFRVLSNENGIIKAIPWYNIETKLDNPKQKANVVGITFSDSTYWIKGQDIDMTAKNDDNSGYKNNIQKYIEAYVVTLENLKAENIDVRAALYSELNSDELSGDIRNPGGKDYYWIGTSIGGPYSSGVRVVGVDGGLGAYNRDNPKGVRPIIIIEY